MAGFEGESLVLPRFTGTALAHTEARASASSKTSTRLVRYSRYRGSGAEPAAAPGYARMSSGGSGGSWDGTLAKRSLCVGSSNVAERPTDFIRLGLDPIRRDPALPWSSVLPQGDRVRHGVLVTHAEPACPHPQNTRRFPRLPSGECAMYVLCFQTASA